MKREPLSIDVIRKHKKIFIKNGLTKEDSFDVLIEQAYPYYERTVFSDWCKGDTYRDYTECHITPIVSYMLVLDRELPYRRNLTKGNHVSNSSIPRRIISISDEDIEIDAFSVEKTISTDIYSVFLVKTNLKHIIDLGYKKINTHKILGDTYMLKNKMDMFYVSHEAIVEPVYNKDFMYLSELENYVNN